MTTNLICFCCSNFTNYLASLSTVELLDSKYSVLVSEAFLQKKSYCNYWVGGFYWDGIEKLTPIQIETHVVANKNDPAFTMRLYWGYFSNGQRSATYHPSSPSSTVWKMLDDGWRCFELNIFNWNLANLKTLAGDILKDAITESDSYAHRLEGFGIVSLAWSNCIYYCQLLIIGTIFSTEIWDGTKQGTLRWNESPIHEHTPRTSLFWGRKGCVPSC